MHITNLFADPLCIQVLPSLVRMCKKDRTVEERVEAAETLAYLIEEDVSLQVSASITDHLIPTLALFLKYSPSSSLNKVIIAFSSQTLHLCFLLLLFQKCCNSWQHVFFILFCIRLRIAQESITNFTQTCGGFYSLQYLWQARQITLFQPLRCCSRSSFQKCNIYFFKLPKPIRRTIDNRFNQMPTSI